MRPPDDGATVSHRTVLGIALPIIVSNVSTPLLGVVDIAVIGRLPDPAYLGAVALGAVVFSFLFWGFGFLRMGTTGLTAQALGADDQAEQSAALGRALLIAAVVGAGLIALQWPIAELAFVLLDGSDKVEALARSYFDIRIWAAPATLANYALLGWFIGLGQARIALLLQLVLNLTNMLLDALFVLQFEMGVEGVAAGTLIADVIAACVGLSIARRRLGSTGWSLAGLLDKAGLARALAVNRDIMVRTLALLAVFVWFMAQGARQGDVLLAANAVLMQFVSVAAYFLDGIAFATEALVGRAVGARRRRQLGAVVRLTSGWALVLAALASLVFIGLGPTLIDALTVDPAVRQSAREHLWWAGLAPLAGVASFQLDGIFIGATRSAEMRNAMLQSLVLFLLGWWLLQPWGNHGLWAALHVSYAARTMTLLRHMPRLLRSVA
ncbi:MATE family efflux transporter [Piscinibacter sakaiensis]|uniref:MATE family efflux transporter n=1 Tax=Piscinibacter sakaiensis TaxID=1547922 RepID=UPI003AB05D10